MASKNILEQANHDNKFIWYKASCACGHELHVANLQLDYDDTGLWLNMYQYCYVQEFFYGRDSWLDVPGALWHRVKLACKILFVGEVGLDCTFMFNGEQAIQDYIDALKIGLDKIKGNKDETA